MCWVARFVLKLSLSLFVVYSSPVRGEDWDTDALLLESAPVETIESKQTKKVFVEGAVGLADQRFELGSRGLRRASGDFYYAANLVPGWRGVISDRIDNIYPDEGGADETVNSLREAYLTWQHSDGGTVAEFGRINLRYGPGYGYNPTDFFRDGALRTVTTVNPLSLRENRLGTFVIRGQRLWSDGSLSVAFSPKLVNASSSHGFSVDLGATNNRDRALLAFSTSITERVSSQVLMYKEAGLRTQYGASMTASLGDATIAFGEWSRGRHEPDLLFRAGGDGRQESTRNRLTGGATYTTSQKLSVTGEYQYNGFALDRVGLNKLSSGGPAALGGYLFNAQRRQDLASRQAYLIYATQESLWHKNLDLTALLQVNSEDRSRLSWIELRHHQSRFDVAIRLQQHSGDPTSEYGLLPYRRSAQILVAYYLQ